MSHRLSVRRGTVAALVAGALVAAMPGAAGAAVPRDGNYSGTTVQPKLNPADAAEQPYAGTVNFRVFKYGSFNGTVRKILKIGASTQLGCASGEVKADRYLVYVILGGKIDRRGAFKYAGNGFTMKGRFTTRTSAQGTLSRTVGDCKAENVSWTAKRSTGGIPIP
jgi:hypothetical protein